ncbi:MAG: hypothetical protein DWQ04_14865, partial [Chloroflexi bacterium]
QTVDSCKAVVVIVTGGGETAVVQPVSINSTKILFEKIESNRDMRTPHLFATLAYMTNRLWLKQMKNKPCRYQSDTTHIHLEVRRICNNQII